MIQVTWVEMLLAGWLAATLAVSVGFCLVRYRTFPQDRMSELTTPSEG